MKNIATLLFVLFVVFSVPVMAGNTVLSDTLIKDFYNESARVITQTPQDNINFIEKHTHDSFHGTLSITVRPQGLPAQKITLSRSKADMLEQIKNPPTEEKYVKADVSVTSIDYLENGTKANVKEYTTLSGYGFTPVQGKNMKLSMETIMTCEDVLSLSPDGVIMVLSSNCRAETMLFPKQ